MSLWRQVARGLRALTHRSAVDAELDDEVRDYYERAHADWVREGLTPEEAARAAQRELGDLARARETLRSYGWENAVDAVARDFRQSFRRLRQTPGFAAVVVLTLALGIGVNVALFSLFQQILLSPLPVPEPDRLVNLTETGPKLDSKLSISGVPAAVSGATEALFSYPMFRDLEREQEAFAGLAAHRLFDASLSTGGQARRAIGVFVSGSYFPVLGLEAALGRLLDREDDRVDGEAESVVLSHAYWRSEFGGDPDVLGRTLSVNGRPLTIVGVAPPGVHGTTVGARASVFVPITFRGADYSPVSIPNHDNRGLHWVYLFARLEPGIDREAAAAAIEPVYRSIVNEIEAPLHEKLDEAFRTKSLVLEPGAHGQSLLFAPARARLEMLFAVSTVVLLLCCANVAGLMLVRGSARTGEMAVRASIGATRGRVASLLLAESLVLAAPAALLSLPVALLTLRGIAGTVPDIPTSVSPFDPSGAFDVSVSVPAALVAIVAAIASALAFGLFPVRDLMRTDTAKTLQAHGARQTAGRRVTRFRIALATVQIALSMALLSMTGAFAQSLAGIARIDLGLDVDSIVTFSISPRTSGYSPEASARLLDRLEEELAAILGVSSVAASSAALLAGEEPKVLVRAVGDVELEELVSFNDVTQSFFETVGIELLAGRNFRDTDAPMQAVIVNQRFAEGFGLGEDAVGAHVRFSPRPDENLEIIGLVADSKYASVTGEIEPQLFLPAQRNGNFYVRAARPREDLKNAVREAIARVDPIVPVTRLRTMDEQVRENLAAERFVAGASTAFAVLATVLAGLGLYGVLAYAFAQRSREIAVRFALGAPASRIRAMVLRPAALIAMIGIPLGVVAAWLLGRAAGSLLFGVGAVDPAALGGAIAVLAVVMLGAACIPARQASRVDPMTVLRDE